ncbi:MAG: hypothetical protein A2W03_18460 [Candidatus Aminicenantes bacterium RBG_16_63_16]|nr:MAG: hypothetical protein A2W03_18460 [Candidatus Aminicenantes bacterium RBG_16_63_16]
MSQGRFAAIALVNLALTLGLPGEKPAGTVPGGPDAPAAAFIDAAAPKGPAYKTVHVFTPSSVNDEKLLFSLLEEFNATLARLGAPGVRYRLWKAVGTKGDTGDLMYESTWPSREVYDRVHKEKEYMALLEKYLPYLRHVLKNEVYSAWLATETSRPEKKGKR